MDREFAFLITEFSLVVITFLIGMVLGDFLSRVVGGFCVEEVDEVILDDGVIRIVKYARVLVKC